MKKAYPTQHDNDHFGDEPVGIVISRGTRAEPTPVFSAYIWESLPSATDETSKAA